MTHRSLDGVRLGAVSRSFFPIRVPELVRMHVDSDQTIELPTTTAVGFNDTPYHAHPGCRHQHLIVDDLAAADDLGTPMIANACAVAEASLGKAPFRFSDPEDLHHVKTPVHGVFTPPGEGDCDGSGVALISCRSHPDRSPIVFREG